MTVTNIESLKVAMDLAERLIKAQHPHLTVVDGSLVQDVAHEYFGNKRRVKVVCQCGAHVERATSDLHTFKGCPVCLKAVRKAEKSAKKLGMAQQLAELKAQLAARQQPAGQPS